MADNFIGLNIGGNAPEQMNKIGNATEQTAASFKSAKAELRALQAEMGNLDVNSKEFAVAAERAGQLKDQLNDAADAVKGSTGPAFESMNNTFGIMGQQITNLDFDGLGQSFTSLSRSVSKVNLKTIKDELGGLAKGFMNLAKSLITNPYIAIAAVIALLVMNFDTIIAKFPAVEKALTGINQLERDALNNAKQRAENSKHEYDNLNKMDNILKARGLSEKQILEYKMKAIEASIRDAKVVLETQKSQATAQIQTAQRNREILEGIIKWINAPLYLLLSAVDKVASFVGQQTNLAEGLVDLAADLIIDPNEKAKEITDSFQQQTDALIEMENQYQGFKLSIKEIDRKAQEERNKKAQEDNASKAKSQEEANKARIASEQERIAEEERIDEEIYQSKLSAQEKELDAVRNKYFELITTAEAFGKDSSALVEAQKREEAAINKKYADEAEKAKQEALDKEWERDMAFAEKQKKQRQEKYEQEKFLHDSRVQMSSDAIGALIALNDSYSAKSEETAKRQFQIGKALSLAQAIISTYQAVNQQLAVPQDALTGANFVKAGIALATGLANVIKISSTQFKSSSAPSAGGAPSVGSSLSGGGGSTQPTSLSLGFLNNQPQQQQPFQAYVIGSQVNTAIEAQALIRNQARLH